ncbi:MAG TPA: alpha-isopropylmalate synthase regulatory domain-containing protein [Candidatus Dormibacteraeota bacterium]|nr:alpha-isopropylmalate synthase regulatory domain-containing protein [Candidatus Dormibacteraeota bacterium]
MTAAQPSTTASPTLHLARWTVTSSSNAQSRGAVVIEAGKHHWRASAEGNGAVDALFKAVDAAIADVLAGHPKLVGYDVHALGEGPDAEGLVIVAIEPPAGLEGDRSAGLYQGRARSTNIIAASIEGYVEALNAMLAEAHWAGAAESAGKGSRVPTESHGRRGKLDKDADDSLPWVG